ncbi:MAG: hypothetical protein R6V05_11645 [Candidatus Brocadiia bacterium]
MHTKLKRLLLLVLAVGLLVGSGQALPSLARMRQRYDLTNEPVTGISPRLALATQVLGWARGIIIDVIWIRMEALKRQGRYFELVQLADWACNLAPRIPEVWDFNSWNLAYNVSCQIDWLPDRWAWVRSGIELLRDEGIPLNPNSPLLYDRLAFMIFHKIGEQSDYAHFYYKQRFALMMHEALGGSGDEETLRGFVDAPKTREQLLADPEVQKLVAACRSAGFDLLDHFLLWKNYPERIDSDVTDLLGRERVQEPLKKIEAYVRARKLKEDFRLDAARMLDLMDSYGPFDWRSPYPHAIYWATMGLEKVVELNDRLYAAVDELGLPVPHTREHVDWIFGDRERVYEYQRTQMERLIYHSLQKLVAHGRVLFDQQGRMLVGEWGSDYRFADAALKMFKHARENWGPRYLRGVTDAYKFFLGQGVVEFHLMGDNRKSHRYFALLKQDFPGHVGDRSYGDYLEWRIEDYTSNMSFSQVRRLVRGFYYRAYLYLAMGQNDKAAALEMEAKLIAQNFDPEEHTNIRGMIRHDHIRRAALVDLLTGKVGIPDEVLGQLKAQLGPEKVKAILANVEKAEREGRPETEEVDESFLKEPD